MKNISKIFCIGLSRTGTNSLDKALEILGYKTKHFPSLKYDSGKLLFKSDEIKKYDAFSDTTVARFYKQLDVKYPNSKFILTVRNKSNWLKSCKRYFSLSKNRSLNKKIKQLRLDLYCTIKFDKKKFKKAYEKHMNDVLSYFKNRKKDLLLINICDGEGWEKLCFFLGHSVPKMPFPDMNKSINKNLSNIYKVSAKLKKYSKTYSRFVDFIKNEKKSISNTSR